MLAKKIVLAAMALLASASASPLQPTATETAAQPGQVAPAIRAAHPVFAEAPAERCSPGADRTEPIQGLSYSHLARRGTSTYAVISEDIATRGASIAAKYSISFCKLSDVNPGVNWNSLSVGQVVQMPSLRKPIVYSVESGDTGNNIAASKNILFADLSSANPTVNWNQLQVNQKLQVPSYGIATTYAVVSGDTGNAIAAGFSVSFSSLQAANPNVNWSNLQVGQVLQIPAASSPGQQTCTTTTTTASGGSPTVTSTATVTGANAVATVTDQDGVGNRPDQYVFYQGDGSTAQDWPSKQSWESFGNMWNNSKPNFGKYCEDSFGVASNSADETQKVYDAIQAVAASSKLDHRFILAVVLQESSGCVRVPTTFSPGDNQRNPGLMQSVNGAGTCNTNGNTQNPCPVSQISQMIQDGSMGTPNGGLVQELNAAGGSGAQSFYKAARLYNAGSVPPNGDLGACGATRCYCSDIANRLMGWVSAPHGCSFPTC